MIKKLKRKIKYKWYRYLVRNRQDRRNHGLTQSQNTCAQIFKQLVIKDDAELLIAPISNTYYVQHGDIFAKLFDPHIHIINGKYSFHVQLPEQQVNELSNFFRGRMEKRRKEMEKEIIDKTNRSLQLILEELKTKSI